MPAQVRDLSVKDRRGRHVASVVGSISVANSICSIVRSRPCKADVVYSRGEDCSDRNREVHSSCYANSRDG